jgi:hypothetical protein
MKVFHGFTGILAPLLFVAVGLLALTYTLSRYLPAEVPTPRRHSLKWINSRTMLEAEERSIGVGCVRVPKGTHGSYTVDVDWSFGHILLADGSRIDFDAGLVESIAIPEERARFLWLRAERRKDGVLYYGAEKTLNGIAFTATAHRGAFPANFRTTQSGPESLNRLLMIARSYSSFACSWAAKQSNK